MQPDEDCAIWIRRYILQRLQMVRQIWAMSGPCRHLCIALWRLHCSKHTRITMTANTPQSRKGKGREFQKKISQLIRSYFNFPDEDAVSTAMGQQGCDIKLSNAARKQFPYGVECKCTESINIWKAWEQATVNAKKEDLRPLLFVKKNYKDPIMVIDAELGLKLLSQIKE